MSHEPFVVRTEPDRLPGRRVVDIVVIAVALTAASVVIVAFWLGPTPHVSTSVKGPAPREISRIEQTLIEIDPVQSELRAEAERVLSRHAWVDREQRIVRIPLSRAYELVMRGAK